MLKNLPVIVLAGVLIAIIGVAGYTDPGNQQKQSRASNSSPATAVSETKPSQTNQCTDNRIAAYMLAMDRVAGVMRQRGFYA